MRKGAAIRIFRPLRDIMAKSPPRRLELARFDARIMYRRLWITPNLNPGEYGRKARYLGRLLQGQQHLGQRRAGLPIVGIQIPPFLGGFQRAEIPLGRRVAKERARPTENGERKYATGRHGGVAL